MKELIADISKKRFEDRANNVLKKKDPFSDLSKEEIQRMSKHF